MSELQNYYNAFCTQYWVHENPQECKCRGSGWALSDVDTWHQCCLHYSNQPYPEEEEE